MINTADALIERAARLSHYVQRLVSAEASLKSDIPVDHAFSAAEMRAALEADHTGDEAGLKRALRTLRKRVMLNLIARVYGFSLWKLLVYIRNELLIVLGTSSSESVLPNIMQ